MGSTCDFSTGGSCVENHVFTKGDHHWTLLRREVDIIILHSAKSFALSQAGAGIRAGKSNVCGSRAASRILSMPISEASASVSAVRKAQWIAL